MNYKPPKTYHRIIEGIVGLALFGGALFLSCYDGKSQQPIGRSLSTLRDIIVEGTDMISKVVVRPTTQPTTQLHTSKESGLAKD